MSDRRRAIAMLAAVLACAGLAAFGAAEPTAAQSPSDERVEDALSALTPAERVGQLFVVPFDGADVGEESAIARLVRERHVGGVVLDPRRGNFSNGADTPEQIARLTNALQAIASQGQRAGLPLIVATGHLGDPFPDTLVLGGMTLPPSQLSLGASWRPEHAESVGEVVGRELAAVGVNLVLGPNLDVAAVPRPGTSGDLGTRVFGGSPSWVARFGQSYVRGVHRGGGGRVATAAASFPGLGGADRSPAEEGAVVESRLEDLATSDLVPFAAVASGDLADVTDAMISSHARYRSVQQQVERPFSLDTGGMRYLWSQTPELAAWRSSGGVVVSSGLGLPAVRRYVDPDLGTFNTRRVIGEALEAGNDLLLLTDFGPPEAPADALSGIEDGIDWLVTRYTQDDRVREAVDAAARRVIALKLRLYGGTSPSDVLVDESRAAAVTGLGGELVAAVASDGLTLLSSNGGAEGPAVATGPQPGERILFVVDARRVAECAGCDESTSPDPVAFVDRVLLRYGPEGSGRIADTGHLSVITFEELKGWLQQTGAVVAEDTPVLVPALSADRLAEVARLLEASDWMVFAMRDLRPAEAPGSDALKLYLRTASADAAPRRLVAAALAAPYYLDTTEIAKLRSYYAVYGRTDAQLDLVARALFGDAPATGASPVSVPGAGYDLERELQPAPDQTVTLELVGHDLDEAIVEGRDLTVRTSVVVDGNGRPAPDGTRVTLRRFDGTEGVFLPDASAATVDGRVTASMQAERPGELVVTAVFENGLRSEPLELFIDEQSSGVGLLPEVPMPSALLAPRVPVDWAILLLSLTLMLLAGVVAYGVDAQTRTPGGRARLVLLGLAWGLAGYLLVATGGLNLAELPGGLRLWPSGWPASYQAPLLAFVLALVPIAPTSVKAIRGAWSAQGGSEAPSG